MRLGPEAVRCGGVGEGPGTEQGIREGGESGIPGPLGLHKQFPVTRAPHASWLIPAAGQAPQTPYKLIHKGQGCGYKHTVQTDGLALKFGLSAQCPASVFSSVKWELE